MSFVDRNRNPNSENSVADLGTMPKLRPFLLNLGLVPRRGEIHLDSYPLRNARRTRH